MFLVLSLAVHCRMLSLVRHRPLRRRLRLAVPWISMRWRALTVPSSSRTWASCSWQQCASLMCPSGPYLVFAKFADMDHFVTCAGFVQWLARKQLQ